MPVATRCTRDSYRWSAGRENIISRSRLLKIGCSLQTRAGRRKHMLARSCSYNRYAVTHKADRQKDNDQEQSVDSCCCCCCWRGGVRRLQWLLTESFSDETQVTFLRWSTLLPLDGARSRLVYVWSRGRLYGDMVICHMTDLFGSKAVNAKHQRKMTNMEKYF